MKQILILILISFTTLLSLKAQNRMELLLETSGNYSFRTFKNTSEFNITTEDKSKFGYSISLKAAYRFARGLYLLSGLEYNNKGFKTAFLYFDEQNNEIQTMGTIDFNFIEVPIYFKYQFLHKKFHILPVVGVSYGRLINLKIKNDISKKSLTQDEIKKSTFNRDVLNLHGGLEFRYQIANKLSFKIEPKIDYTLSDVNKGHNKLIKEHLYLIGINLGLIRVL